MSDDVTTGIGQGKSGPLGGHVRLPYDIAISRPGVPGDAEVMFAIKLPRAMVIPANWAGSVAGSLVAAAAPATISVVAAGSVVGTIGTISFAAGATSGTFAAAGGFALKEGDVLKLVNQAMADASLSDLFITIKGSR